jgi:hypothetical protein
MAIVVVLLSVCLGWAGAAPAAYCGAENIEAVEGAVRLAAHWGPVFAESFEQGLGEWRIDNYEGKLTVGADAEGADGGCALVANHGAQGDTAWELASPPAQLTYPRPEVRGARFRLSFSWRANRSLERLSGHQGHYLSEVQWLDAAGQEVGATPFVFGKASDEWQSTEVEGDIPKAATQVVIRFGCDSPNIDDGEFVAIDRVRLGMRVDPPQFEPAGTLLSRPMHAPGGERRLSWEADTPANTAVRVQVAAAPDVGGGPGEWSAYVGPDGAEGSAFTKSAPLPPALRDRPWVRYRATLATDDPAATPALRSVSIGEATDGPWTGLDTLPPTVSDRSPTRTADPQPPIRFTLSDETGIDRRTVRVWLDGAEITEAVALQDGRYGYTPPAPLTPPPPEMSVARWRIDNYQGSLQITRAPRVEGGPLGLHITRDTGEVDTAFRAASPLVPVEPGAKYVLSCWSRHSVNLQGAMSGEKTYSGGVTWLDADGAPVGERVRIDFGPADAVWHRDEYEMTAPPGAANAQIAFGFDNPNLFGGASVDIAEVTLDGPHPAREETGPNLHRVSVQAADFAGNTLRRDWYVLIRPPRTENVVTLREDGTVLIDGKPFFPIGLYAVWKKPFNEDSFDKAFGDLKVAGFNLAHTYTSTRGPDFAEFYAAAARHGIKLYVASDAGANCMDAERVLWDVAREEGQPALLSWYLADDTASHVAPEELSTLTEAIDDIDPAHITVQADGVGGPPVSRYAAYVAATDGFLPELYPVRDDSDRGVPRIIADMETVRADLRNAGAKGKTVWPIIQYFQGWGWPRYPTREELWAMSYLSIVYGANGITWYTYGGWGDNHGVTDTPEVWGNICQLAGELAQLQDVLVEPTGPQPAPPEVLTGPETDALGYPSINVLLKQHAGKTYLLAANSARAEVSAQLAAPGARTVSLPFENRQVTADGTGFQDTFEPYGVHVYVW